MAILSFQEKQLIERTFGMGGGYVLNFTNREFEEFMKGGCIKIQIHPLV